MLRTIFWALWMIFYLIRRLPSYWKVKRLARQNREEERWALVQKRVLQWSGRLVKNIGLTVTVEGAQNLPKAGEVAVFAVNHQSFLDIPVVLSNLDMPHPLMAKTELGRVPLLNGWMQQLGCVYVDRNDTRASIRALKKAEETVKAGRSFIIFPEGTRSETGEIGEFKAGAVRIATKTNVPVIPVMVDGTRNALEGNKNRLKKADVRLVICPAVQTEGLTREEQKTLHQKLEETVRQAKGNNRPAGAV